MGHNGGRECGGRDQEGIDERVGVESKRLSWL